MAFEITAKIGTHGSTRILVAGRERSLARGERIEFKESVGCTPWRNLKWQAGVVWKFHPRDSFIFVDRA